MRRIIFGIVFVLTSASASAHAGEKCTFDNLTEYSLILSVTETKKKYLTKIYLPNIKKINGEFCGFWINKELTNNINHQYYGFKDTNSYITLNPELNDIGLGINLTNNDQWTQEGPLIKRGIAGAVIGTYKIDIK